jgi:hypothetical protein
MIRGVLEKKIKDYKRRFPTVKELQITKSKRDGKRFKAVFSIDGKQQTVHFGFKSDKGKPAKTFADGASKEKRQAYRARHSKIMNVASGKPAYQCPGTPASFSYYILW